MAPHSDRIRARVYEGEYNVIDDRLLDFGGEPGSHVHNGLNADFEVRSVAEKWEAWRDELRWMVARLIWSPIILSRAR